MTPKPYLSERTFVWGRQQWKTDSTGSWSVYMWGWWPDSHGYPSGRFVPIDIKRVPRELLDLAVQ